MLMWYAAGLIAAIAVGWLAAAIHASGYAPLGLVSLAAGVGLGLLLRSLPVARKPVSRRAILVSTFALALVAVVAQHAWLYRDFRRQWHRARSESAEVALFRSDVPWSPREYFMRELTPQRAALWCLDAAMVATGAVLTVGLLNREPC